MKNAPRELTWRKSSYSGNGGIGGGAGNCVEVAVVTVAQYRELLSAAR